MKIKETSSETEEQEDLPRDVEDRKFDYSKTKDVKKQLDKVYEAVEKAFEDKSTQNNDIDECWDIYNCVLNANQQYSGKSQAYVPAVRDAVNARKTRFINTLFPQSGRYADVTSNDGHVPYDLIALLDYYVQQAALRRNVMPALIRMGDIGGNYSLYVEWGTKSRFIVNKEKKAEIELDGVPAEDVAEYDDVEYQETVDSKAMFSVIDPRNLVILPTSIDDIEDAEVVAIAMRLTAGKLKALVKEGVLEKSPTEDLIENMNAFKGTNNQTDTLKKAVEAAGIKSDSKGNKTALVYQVWATLKIKGERRLCVTHFAGRDTVLGCKRNPYWNDRVPVIHQPVEKEADSIWGASQVKPVAPIQYAATDAANMGLDSAQYALLPIIMVDPEKNPQIGSMVMSMAAVWMTDPNSTKFAQFPALWKDSLTLVGTLKEQVFQSLGVNPAMMPHGNANKKPSQSEVAQAQQVALESTNDEITILEAVLSKCLEWCYDLDYQYRTEDITVRKFGQLGLQATMDQVKPFQIRERYTFRWYGVESFKAAQQVQQMISWGNVLKGIPPQMLNGRKVDLSPMLEFITEVTCGPRIAPHTLVDKRHEMSMTPETENELMDNGFPVQVHEGDNDVEHIQSHMAHGKINPTEYLRGHMLEHMQQMKKKAAAQQMAQMPPPPGAAPGGPRPGAVAQPPTGAQNPPGAVHPDQMPMAMPRSA